MSDRNDLIAATLPDYRRWLYRTAYNYLPNGSGDVDDLAQEGYIAMWRALDTFDPDKGALASWLTGAARLRMRDVAHGGGAWTGHEATRGKRSVATESLDAHLDADETLHGFAAVDVLDGIESAYHHGEIMKALAALTPAQREYVHLRFWMGVDPTSRAPVTRALVELFPVVRKSWLWRGSDRTVGARQVLRERLAHLADVA